MIHGASQIKVVLSLALCLGLSLCLGCSDDCVNGPDEMTLADAWGTFAGGEYDEAVTDFHTLIASDSSSSAAYSGLGWSFAFNDQLDSAHLAFDHALQLDSSLTDVLAGQSAVSHANGDFTSAIVEASMALALEPEWSFAHNPTIDYRDLHLIMAEAYFALGDGYYASALQRVKILNPGSTLSPDDAQTWDNHPTYAAALLKEIETLEAIIGADMLL